MSNVLLLIFIALLCIEVPIYTAIVLVQRERIGRLEQSVKQISVVDSLQSDHLQRIDDSIKTRITVDSLITSNAFLLKRGFDLLKSTDSSIYNLLDNITTILEAKK